MTATWLVRLRDATPAPPDTDDIAELLAAFARMSAERQRVLDDARRGDPIDRALVDEIEARQAAWRRTLASARHRVAAHIVGAKQARRYR